jgi:hypothetical protein
MPISPTSAPSPRPTAVGLQRQRLGRDAAGPVRVGRQASSGQLRGGGRDRGFDAKRRMEINTTVTRAYREAMRDFADMRNLDLW